MIVAMEYIFYGFLGCAIFLIVKISSEIFIMEYKERKRNKERKRKNE